jgi:glycosyltransferase involved in cell wall biosynthesis
MADIVGIFSYKPVISIIVPVFNPPEQFLRQAIESVLNQVYHYWELCIADDASTKPYVRNVVEEYISKDSRIKVVFREENGTYFSCF